MEERKAQQEDKKVAPEIDEDGTFFDKGYQELVDITEDELMKELEDF